MLNNNINLLSLDTRQHYNNFYDRVTAKSFFPKITLPTRIQNESYTLIDNIFSNDIEETMKSKSGILINNISDHQMIFTFHENLSYIEKIDKYIYVEKHDEISLEQFINELNKLDIYEQLDQNIHSSPQENYEIFSKLVKYAKDKYLPKRKMKYDKKRHMQSSWMTRGILNSINTKNMLYKTFIQANSQNVNLYRQLKEEYATYKTKLRKSIREAKRLHYLRLFTLHKNDIKKTWELINSTIKNKPNSKSHCEFVLDGRTITNSGEIATAFNEYFVNIGRKLSSQIHPVHQHSHYLVNEANKCIQFEAVNESNINDAINRLKNKSSYGHDEISNKTIKHAKNILIRPLTLIINQMLQTGEFPNDLKISRVKPLFKSGETSSFSNYRPISLLPSFSKIFEYVIFKQLYSYMDDNRLFSLEQYGFRIGHSTELAALHLVNHLTKQMDTGKIPINIYIDLSKAFDTLDHAILLDKLKYYGIRGVAYRLFHSYLSNRYQYVEFNGSISSTKVIDTGVPQGSILRPLLFLIYINDLPCVSPLFNMVMYADGTTLYCNLSNNANENYLNSELNKISEWLASNKLSLNTRKTKFMVFHTVQRKIQYPILTINNTVIERVKQFNFLGIILHYTLKWQKHIDHVSKKVSKAIGVMYRLKHVYPEAVLLILYQSIIYAHFNYGILVWGSKINTDHPLHLLQKRALRIVVNQDYIAHSEPICKSLGLLRVPNMFKFALWKFYFRLMNNKLPTCFEYLKPVLPRICDIHTIRRPSFHLPFIKHDFAEQLLCYQLPKILNENGSNRISSKVFTHSFSGFSNYIKNAIIDTYIMHCNIINCVSCSKFAN